MKPFGGGSILLIAAEHTIPNNRRFGRSHPRDGLLEQAVADCGEQHVAHQMAVQVVERLEPVDVKFDQGAGRAGGRQLAARVTASFRPR